MRWNGLARPWISTWDFQKIAPYYYTGWHEPATELQFMVNKEAFDALPAHLQEHPDGCHAVRGL